MAHSNPLYFSPSQAQLYFIINKTMLSITTLPTSATIKALSAFYQSHEIRIIIILYFWMFHINFCSHQSFIFKAMYKLSQLQTYVCNTSCQHTTHLNFKQLSMPQEIFELWPAITQSWQTIYFVAEGPDNVGISVCVYSYAHLSIYG